MPACECDGGETTPSFTSIIKICDCDCECNCYCCIDRLYSSIEEDASWLQKMEEIQFVHTPLHVAAAEGNTMLAVEIMNLMPSLGKKLNPQGLSPLHIAVENGKFDVALALVKLDKQLVGIKGKGGITPLHRAAAQRVGDNSDQLELLARFLVECPASIGVLNNRLQSAVHVALENQNVESARLLVNWLIIMAKETNLATKDSKGNTTLHVAARYCRYEELLKLLSKLVKVDIANNYGETAIDIAIKHGNREAIETLRNAGAMNRTTSMEDHPHKKISPMVQYLLGNYADKWAERFTRAYYFLTKELTMDMCNTILVVAVLIATATYQGVLQPPGGVYSAEGNGNATKHLGSARRLEEAAQKHPPGQLVMGTTKYSYFMPTNTLAFISSTLIIIFVLPDRAYVMILQACLIFMCISYLLALNFISDYNKFSKILDIVCGCVIAVASSMKLVNYFVKAHYNKDEWLLRRVGVMINNSMSRFTSKDMSRRYFLSRMRKQYKLISKSIE